MKERFLLAVSWLAFTNAAVIGLMLSLGVLGFSKQDLPTIASMVNVYKDLMLGSWTLAFGLSPFIWVVLWIVTGSPRFLPWKQPQQAENE